MTVGNENWLLPDWPAPARVRACVTTRQGGVSAAPFDSFNLGDHVGDDPAAVASNRQHLRHGWMFRITTRNFIAFYIKRLL